MLVHFWLWSSVCKMFGVFLVWADDICPSVFMSKNVRLFQVNHFSSAVCVFSLCRRHHHQPPVEGGSELPRGFRDLFGYKDLIGSSRQFLARLFFDMSHRLGWGYDRDALRLPPQSVDAFAARIVLVKYKGARHRQVLYSLHERFKHGLFCFSFFLTCRLARFAILYKTSEHSVVALSSLLSPSKTRAERMRPVPSSDARACEISGANTGDIRRHVRSIIA